MRVDRIQKVWLAMRVVERWYISSLAPPQKSSISVCTEQKRVKHLPNHRRQVYTSLRSRDDPVNRLALQRALRRDLIGSSGQQKELNREILRHTLAQKHTGGGSMREDVPTDGFEGASCYKSHGRSRIG